MNEKFIKLNISTSQTPFTLEIRSFDGVLLAKKVVKQIKSQHCLCLCSNSFYLVGKFRDQTIRTFYNVSNYDCLDLFVAFNFTTNIASLQTFYLIDSVYSLPIPNAILEFNEQ